MADSRRVRIDRLEIRVRGRSSDDPRRYGARIAREVLESLARDPRLAAAGGRQTIERVTVAAGPRAGVAHRVASAVGEGASRKER